MHRLFIASILFGFLTGCSNKPKKSIQTHEPVFNEEGTLFITRKSDTLLRRLSIEIANTPYERETGLMYRSSMEKNQGMLFVFDNEAPRAFYMKNTLLSLDIIYLNKNLEVVDIIAKTKPLNEKSLPSKSPAKFVLELVGGRSAELKIAEGDQVSYYTP